MVWVGAAEAEAAEAASMVGTAVDTTGGVGVRGAGGSAWCPGFTTTSPGCPGSTAIVIGSFHETDGVNNHNLYDGLAAFYPLVPTELPPMLDIFTCGNNQTLSVPVGTDHVDAVVVGGSGASSNHQSAAFLGTALGGVGAIAQAKLTMTQNYSVVVGCRGRSIVDASVSGGAGYGSGGSGSYGSAPSGGGGGGSAMIGLTYPDYGFIVAGGGGGIGGATQATSFLSVSGSTSADVAGGAGSMTGENGHKWQRWRGRARGHRSTHQRRRRRADVADVWVHRLYDRRSRRWRWGVQRRRWWQY